MKPVEPLTLAARPLLKQISFDTQGKDDVFVLWQPEGDDDCRLTGYVVAHSGCTVTEHEPGLYTVDTRQATRD